MPPLIETFRSHRTPWEVFQAVYENSKACFFLDSPDIRPLSLCGAGGDPAFHSCKKNNGRNSSRCVPSDPVFSYIGRDPVLEIRLEKNKLILSGEENKTFRPKNCFPCSGGS